MGVQTEITRLSEAKANLKTSIESLGQTIPDTDKLDAYPPYIDAVKAEQDALVTYANETTGAGDTSIGDAVQTLVDGYGKGGGLEYGTLLYDADVSITLKKTSTTTAMTLTGLSLSTYPHVIVIIKALTLNSSYYYRTFCIMEQVPYYSSIQTSMMQFFDSYANTSGTAFYISNNYVSTSGDEDPSNVGSLWVNNYSFEDGTIYICGKCQSTMMPLTGTYNVKVIGLTI